MTHQFSPSKIKIEITVFIFLAFIAYLKTFYAFQNTIIIDSLKSHFRQTRKKLMAQTCTGYIYTICRRQTPSSFAVLQMSKIFS
jgi:hypothetical protein